MTTDALEIINERLPLRFTRTVRGEEIKGFGEDGKIYLGAADCDALAAAFTEMAKELREGATDG